MQVRRVHLAPAVDICGDECAAARSARRALGSPRRRLPEPSALDPAALAAASVAFMAFMQFGQNRERLAAELLVLATKPGQTSGMTASSNDAFAVRTR
jgi:hypothetical protein